MRDAGDYLRMAAVIGVMGVPVLLPLAFAAARRGGAAGSWGLLALLALLAICVTTNPILLFAIPFILILSVPIGFGLLARQAADDMRRELEQEHARHRADGHGGA